MGHRMTRAAVAGLLALAATTLGAATAAAEPPPPPPDPVPAPQPAPAPPPSRPEQLASTPLDELVLGQHSVPSAPGGQPAAPPGLEIVNGGQFMDPLNFRKPKPDQPPHLSPYVLGPGDPHAPGRINSARGMHAYWHSMFGKIPVEHLDDPLPGTVLPETLLPETAPPPPPG